MVSLRPAQVRAVIIEAVGTYKRFEECTLRVRNRVTGYHSPCMANTRERIVFALLLLLGSWLTYASASSAVKTFRHKGGGTIVVSASRPDPITGDMGGEKELSVDESDYKRNKYTGSAIGLFVGVVILWCAFQRPYDARLERALPPN